MNIDRPEVRKCIFAQGSVLPVEASVKLNLISAEDSSSQIAVVISHDCDIAERDLEAEPFLEVVIGRWIDRCDPNFSNSKSTRLLHLEVEEGEERRPIELSIIRRANIRKADASEYSPDAKYMFSADSKRVIRNWLAARYNRPAFPDELNRRLRPMQDAMIAAAKTERRGILAYFLDCDPTSEELDPDESYEIRIYIVYEHEVAGAREFAQETASAIQNKLERKFRHGTHWQLVDLRLCEAVSDTEFTLFDAMTTKQYRLDYLSLRKSPQEPTISLA